MAFQFRLPERTIMGTGALEASGPIIKGLGKKAFVVTGKNVTKAGAVKKLTDLLQKWEVDFAVFDDIVGEPTDGMISEGVRAYKSSGCDVLIAIGGGSPQDSAKAIGAMSVLPGSVSDYIGAEITGDFPPAVMIPTTAGTGSEATKFAVITDSAKGIKIPLRGDALIPTLAVVDPELTLTAPKSVTASTGMDALTHAVEAYTSRKGNALSDAYALDAVKRIFAWLPVAYENGSDIKAREELAIAAYEAGVCINNASVTLVHGLSRPIGALFHVPHGISNAMLITECLTFAADGCPDKFAVLGRAIGAAHETDSDEQAANRFLESLGALCERLDIPTLEGYGIDRKKHTANIGRMARDAIKSGSPANTIKPVTQADAERIYQRLLQ